jgi:hypothetical protein
MDRVLTGFIRIEASPLGEIENIPNSEASSAESHKHAKSSGMEEKKKMSFKHLNRS